MDRVCLGTLDLAELFAEPLYGLSWGWPTFEEISGGLIPGKLICFSAPSGVGKTTTLISICADAANSNPSERFLYIATEQTVREIATKFLAHNSGLNTHDLDHMWWDKLDAITRHQLFEAQTRLTNISFVYYDSADFDLDAALEEAGEAGIRYVFYDYLGALATNGDNEWRQLEMLADKLKRWAEKYGGTIVTATQTSIDATKNAGNGELKDERYIANSKGIARKLDVGCILDKDPMTSKVSCHVYKNRNGESRRIIDLDINWGTCTVKEAPRVKMLFGGKVND